MDINQDEAFNSFLPGQKQDDSTCIARFHVKPYLMAAKSREAGREVWEDREYCEIMVKGQPHQVVDEQVKPIHIQRFPNAYAAFKAGRPALVVGTPIEQLPNMSPSLALTLKALGIRVMEDMVALDDMGLQKVGMGARELQKQCKAFLEKTTVNTLALAEENAALKASQVAMAEQLAKMQEQIAALSAKPRRGRPPKSQPDKALQ